MAQAAISRSTFFGWRVVAAAFVLAVFGWGVGFYGPPVFLRTIVATRGWPVALVSAAVTVHFLTGALLAVTLPHLYGRFGASTVTCGGALLLATGVVAWSLVAAPWQLFAAAVLTGAGWGTSSAAALNAIVSPWFSRARPAALAMAYNGGSVGGIVFSPLWATSVAALGFPLAAGMVAVATVLTLSLLASVYFARTPQDMGLLPDGDAVGASRPALTSHRARPLPGRLLRADRQFRTLAAGMAFGLFAQIGLVAHLYSLLVPALGPSLAGAAMGLVTAMAIGGRTATGWLMGGADRRRVAAFGYAAQLTGSLVLALAAGTCVPLLVAGLILFGMGFGNATSLPPLIAQVEFMAEDVGRAVPLIVGIAQATYAFAPAAFGLLRQLDPFADAATGAAPCLFVAAALLQGSAIAAFLAGRRQ